MQCETARLIIRFKPRTCGAFAFLVSGQSGGQKDAAALRLPAGGGAMANRCHPLPPITTDLDRRSSRMGIDREGVAMIEIIIFDVFVKFE